MKKSSFFNPLIKVLAALLCATIVIAAVIIILSGSDRALAFFAAPQKKSAVTIEKLPILTNAWQAPDINALPEGERKSTLEYGKELICNTATYFGPKGSIAAISNGMNCQNCHLNGGTKIMGNNYSAVASTYPKLRARSGTIETVEKRVNDCLQRSLNGLAIADDSKEMKAMVAYITWLGAGITKPPGVGIVDLPYLNREASMAKGDLIYQQKCVSCHGKNGEGIVTIEGNAYVYPPLWGENSYNTGAGLYRLSRFAGYVKANMPLGATYDNPQLTNEEAWDVAAYVNSMPRLKKDFVGDWPDISKKPIDHPFGPYADPFTEVQHKYGPFEPIKNFIQVKPQ